MITDEWIYRIEQAMPFAPTAGQHEAVGRIARLLAAPCDVAGSERPAMILRGSAGTGKTSVARALVGAMTALRRQVVLLAPTGRAAKVLAMGTGHAAHTIHRHIYRQRAYMDSRFALNDNLHRDTLFLIDEASMIATQTGDTFGSGNLLDDLVKYVYSAPGCRMLLIGDTAQLPPVGYEEAPALVTDYLRGYGLEVIDCDLTEVLRQAAGSGILVNATRLRTLITHDELTQLPRISLRGFADISICPGSELIEALASSFSRVGTDETIVVTRSNKRAVVFNRGIRAQVLWREEELTSGDELMVVKNNYFWTRGDKHAPAFLANGDRARVRRVRGERTLYGFRFAEATLVFPDYDDYELTCTIMLDTLLSEAPALTAGQQETLYQKVLEDYAHIARKPERMEALRSDRFFNALQIKYAYAVTCHKAQGGQWADVYLDQGYMTDDMLTPSYIHWLYTAFTRATRHLYLVNWPKTQIKEPPADD